MSRIQHLAALSALCFCLGCSPNVSVSTPQRAVDPDEAKEPLDANATVPAKLTITSPSFRSGGPIPKRHTADGEDRSPPLAIAHVSVAAKELALICEDPDAPTPQPWIHWVIYKIPPDTRTLPEGIPHPANPPIPEGAVQGANSWGAQSLGYRGPDPPRGKLHHYYFHLYALDAPLDVKAGLDKNGLLAAMKGHIVAEAVLVGTYQR